MVKKISFAVVFIMLLGSLAMAKNVYNNESIVENATTKSLGLGEVTIYDFGNIKLHSYKSNDPLGDVSYAFESDSAIVILESAAFKPQIREWANYLNSLGKSLEGSIMAYHAVGGSTYNLPIPYATQNALDTWKASSTGERATRFAARFGNDLDTDTPTQINLVKFGETKTIGAMQFKFIDVGDSAFNVEVPQINVIYRHSFAPNSHTAVRSIKHLDDELKTLRQYKKKGYVLILSSHSVPVDQNAVAQKISYFNTIKSLAKKCKTKDEFLTQAKDAFPDYAGESDLERTANALYQ